MDFPDPHEEPKSTVAVNSNPAIYRLINGTKSRPSSSFEIRLFYVRISACVTDTVPNLLTLSHLRRQIGSSLEINGSRIPSDDIVSLSLRRDRIDKDSSEVTYVSTDSVQVIGALDFEVFDGEDLILCGSLERLDQPVWINGRTGPDKGSKSGWSMDCYAGGSLSAFFQPKRGISSPSIEVYVAGCSSGFPLILTKTIQLSPRRQPTRHVILDSIPEDEETGQERSHVNGFLRHRPVDVST